MEENTQIVESKKDTKTIVKKVLYIAGNVVFYVFIIALFLFSIMNINGGNKDEGFPNIFGNGFLSVQSDSMEHKGTNYASKYTTATNPISKSDAEELWASLEIQEINTGDLVYAKTMNVSKCASLKVGDVITFYDLKLKSLNTHRIVYINVEEQYVYTQGDKVALGIVSNNVYRVNEDFASAHNVNVLDSWNSSTPQVELVEFSNIKGLVTGVNHGAGKVLDNIRQNWLFYFVLPVIILLLFEIFMVIKNVMDLRHEKQKTELASDKDTMMAEIAAEKEKMRQELLAELMAQQQAMNNTSKPEPEEEKKEVVEETIKASEEVVEEEKAEETVEEVAEASEETKKED